MFFQKIDKYASKSLSFLDNEYISTLIKLFLTVYAAVWAPRLPPAALKLFSNNIFKLFVFASVIWVSTKDLSLALLISLAFLLSMNSLRSGNIGNSINKLLSDMPIPSFNSDTSPSDLNDERIEDGELILEDELEDELEDDVEEDAEEISDERLNVKKPQEITPVVYNQLKRQDLDNIEDLLENVSDDVKRLLEYERNTSPDIPDENLPGFNELPQQGRNGEQTNIIEQSGNTDLEQDYTDFQDQDDLNTENFHNFPDSGETMYYAPLHPDEKHQGPQGLGGPVRGIEGQSIGSWVNY